MNNATAIGQLKSKVTKYCTVCNYRQLRKLVAPVYANTPAAIGAAKAVIASAADRPYTCRVCKSIQDTV